MRKAAAVLIIPALISISAWTAGVPEGASERGGASPSLFARAGAPGALAFSLAEGAGPSLTLGVPSLDLQDHGASVTVGSAPQVPSPGLARDPAARRLAVSFFLGRGNGDIFSSLHDQYTWRLLGRSMTVGLGLYREIPIYKGIGLLPYVGIIRASATLGPSGLYGSRESFEYALTAFCIGLPFVFRFN